MSKTLVPLTSINRLQPKIPLPIVDFQNIQRPTDEELKEMIMLSKEGDIPAIKQILRIMLSKAEFKLYEYQLTLLATFIAGNYVSTIDEEDLD